MVGSEPKVLTKLQAIARARTEQENMEKLSEMKNSEEWKSSTKFQNYITKTWLPQHKVSQEISLTHYFLLWKHLTFIPPSKSNFSHARSVILLAASRLYILRVCKYYGYTKDQLSKLFDSLIMRLFLYELEVWGSAYQRKPIILDVQVRSFLFPM